MEFSIGFLPVWGIFKALDENLSLVAKIENESLRYILVSEPHINLGKIPFCVAEELLYYCKRCAVSGNSQRG